MTNQDANKNNLTGCLCALGCETLFGLSYIFTRTATQVAGPFALLGWRFVVAFALMRILIMLGFVKIDLKGKALKPLLFIALFSPCVYFVGETLGIRQTTASESGVILASIPIASLIASALILKKRPSAIQITGIGVTLSGVVLTVLAVGVASSLSVTGYLFLLLAVTAYAFYSVCVDKAAGYTGTEITYIMLTAGAVVFGAIGLGEAIFCGTVKELLLLPFVEKDFAIAVFFQSVGCSIIAFFLSNTAIAKIGVNRAASFIGVSTVVSTIAGALFLRESFTAFQIVGAVIIVAGVYIANIRTNS